MTKQSAFILSVFLVILVACSLSAPSATETPAPALLTFTEPTVEFSFNYPDSLIQNEPIGTIPYMINFADSNPTNPQIVELTVAELPDGIVTLDEMRANSLEVFETGIFDGASLTDEDRRSIGSGLEANIYFVTLSDGTDTIMAETTINGYGVYFRAFGGSEVIDMILTSLVIE